MFKPLKISCRWPFRQPLWRITIILMVWSCMYLLLNQSWKENIKETESSADEVLLRTVISGAETVDKNKHHASRDDPLSSADKIADNFIKTYTISRNHSLIINTVDNFILDVDYSPKRSSAEIVKQLAQTVQSIPLHYLKLTHSYKSKKCASHPNFYDLQFNNIAWQYFHSSAQNGSTFYIFGAYYDNRSAPVVRVLVMVDKISPPNITCQLWYGPFFVITTPITESIYIWNRSWGNYKDGILQPFLLTCPCKQQSHSKMIPSSVSLVDNGCDNATNNIRVFYSHPPVRQGFAVCVKGMSFWEEDISIRLIEWLELLHLLGANKVFFYELSVHPNISKVLNYYQKLGRVESTFLTLPGYQPNHYSMIDFYLKNKRVAKRQNEVIPYNDCFYKNMYTYKYIVLLDTDEIIVPLKDKSWTNLMNRVWYLAKQYTKGTRGAFYARNVYFFDDSVHLHGWLESVPHYMHFLQHVYRAKNHTKPGSFVKSFFDTTQVVALHNHFPIRCLRPDCRNYEINKSLAQLQHYRQDCDASIRKDCVKDFHKFTVMDDNLWRFKDPLVRNVNQVLQDLGFLKWNQENEK